MGPRLYFLVCGCIFGAVALLHLLRLVNGWGLVLGPWPLPMWLSWTGALVPALLCMWGLRLASRR